MKKVNRYTNPMFWIGILTVIFLAAGIDPESLTNWPLVLEGLKSIILSPVKFIAVIGAVYAVINNNGNKGLYNPLKKK